VDVISPSHQAFGQPRCAGGFSELVERRNKLNNSPRISQIRAIPYP
jgi:hypothetical protein